MLTEMNEFETKMNALRLQFKAERLQIQKDCNLTIGHLNTAIGQVNTPEAREALRAEKQRVYEATRQSMKYNRLCYRQQLDAITAEYEAHRSENPSRHEARRALALLCRYAELQGEQSLSLNFGNNRHGQMTFS